MWNILRGSVSDISPHIGSLPQLRLPPKSSNGWGVKGFPPVGRISPYEGSLPQLRLPPKSSNGWGVKGFPPVGRISL
ncbi:hypothetical protein TNIN_384071 [Trichonephila inaurata madagascariensis]|uniref:Uncharacterized protein n=1 Tax=Trichonephila inaurata madagascariensis TaxID=2747483 RepID=A0A8X6YSU1_9ARAC|nr:hypothetical protein TNIN_384071 [Trichonephila inaurata madagascariensis]